MKFTKMQSAGNDYVIIESGDVNRNWPQLAIAMCDRHYGIGADSLLLMLPSSKADFRMQIFDADGSEAEACGNGTRCLAKYVFEKGIMRANTDQLRVETLSGIRAVQLRKENGRIIDIQANMGEPRFGADDIPVTIKQGNEKVSVNKSMLGYSANVDGKALSLNLVSMGNPHAVYFQPEAVTDFPLSQIGPKVENLEIFPRRTNFEVVRVINREQVEARTWERGVGETLACGSGACAIIAAAQLLGYVDSKIEVKVLGGTLGVEWNGKREILLSGPAEIVFTGEWPDEVQK